MNKQVILSKRVQGLPPEDTWTLQSSAIPEPAEGQMLVEIHYASLDPAMRGWINDRKSYIPPVGLGEVMRALTVGKVLASAHPWFPAGSWVSGPGGIQEYVCTSGEGWYLIDPSIAPLPKYLSVLGMTGYTAYFGLLDVGRPQEGETLLVSGAAGAVGSVVGQIGKIRGCQVVGVAGGPEKCEYVTESLGFDACIDYKQGKLYEAIKYHCSKGVDIYFDNVGGETLDAALALINRKARIVLCGGISQYNSQRMQGPSNYLSLLTNRARMEGFIVFDYAEQYPTAAKQLGQWLEKGLIQSAEHIESGIEQFYPSFLKLFSGEKRGKMILQIKT